MKKRLLCAALAALLVLTAGCGAASSAEASASAASDAASSAAAASAASGAVSAAESAAAPFYASTDDVTVDSLIARTTPTDILSAVSGFRVDQDYENTGSDELDSASVYTLYCKTGEYIAINERMDLADGSYSLSYMSNDPNDLCYYATGDTGHDYNEITAEDVSSLTDCSLFGLDTYDCTITAIREENGSYVAELSAVDPLDGSASDADAMTYTLTIDPAAGLVTDTVFSCGDEDYTLHSTLTYGDDFTPDLTPKTDNGFTTDASAGADAAGETADTGDSGAAASGAENTLQFTAQDLDGSTYTLDDFKGARVIMVNYWEPWCGPCVGEMPDLETLYEKYKDQGLVILGVFTTEGEDDDARAVLEDCGVTYPVVRADAGLTQYCEDFVPSTIFVSPDGTVLTDECYDGARDLDEWDSIIQSYLE